MKRILNELKELLGISFFKKVYYTGMAMAKRTREIWADPVLKAEHIAKYRKPKNFSAEELQKRRQRCLDRNADPEFHKNKSYAHTQTKKFSDFFSKQMKLNHANGCLNNYIKRNHDVEVVERINVNSGVLFEDQLAAL